MAKGKIFIVDDQRNILSEMNEEEYETEDILQKLIEQYPDLLAGDQIDPENPRNWLLISREVPIPDTSSGTGRWSLDHLYIDQDGIPTFVECKRSRDTRTRREVVAQMLEYAANGTEYWSIDKIREIAEKKAQERDESLSEIVSELTGLMDNSEIENFWTQVEDNFKNGRVRLIFAADETPKELRRLVEFLNEKMTGVEVLIVEIKQFLGIEGQRVIVPRVLGITETARIEKRSQQRRKRHQTETEFLSTCFPATRDFFSKIVRDVNTRGHKIYWGSVGFSVRIYHQSASSNTSVVYCFPPDAFQVFFGHFKYTNVPNEEVDQMRTTMVQTGIFDKSTEYTLTSYISEKDLDEVFGIYLNMMNWAEEQAKKY